MISKIMSGRLLLKTIVLGLLLAGEAAFAADGFGRVTFPNSGSPAAQADFLAGLAMLHDFEYEAAIDAFKRAEAADPDFAMAYWGEAMSYNHPIWMQQDPESARAALNRLAPTSAGRRAKAKTIREKEYFDAIEILYGDGTKAQRDLRFEAAMAHLHERYPDDVNATAFYGLAILGTAHSGRDIPVYMRAAGILEEAWVTNQEHPGLLHYLIHCYDDPTHAPLGLRAARIYARIAPDAGHAQHMTSHIFLALGMWNETVAANLAANAAVKRMDGADPGCGHYPTWLSYAYLQLDERDRALAAVKGCSGRAAALPDAHAEMSMDPDNSHAGSLANMRLRYLIDTSDWNGEVAKLRLPPNAGPGARLDFSFADVLTAIGLRNAEAADRALAKLELAAKEVVEIETRSGNPDPTYRERPTIFILEAQGLRAELKGDATGAEGLLREAASREDALPIAFGPPTIDKPTRELLGEFLLRRGKLSDARAEFTRALARTPGRRLAVKGLAATR